MAGRLQLPVNVARSIGCVVEPFGAEATIRVLQSAKHVSLIVRDIFGCPHPLPVNRFAPLARSFTAFAIPSNRCEPPHVAPLIGLSISALINFEYSIFSPFRLIHSASLGK